jgi:hypothetical protein
VADWNRFLVPAHSLFLAHGSLGLQDRLGQVLYFTRNVQIRDQRYTLLAGLEVARASSLLCYVYRNLYVF